LGAHSTHQTSPFLPTHSFEELFFHPSMPNMVIEGEGS
jgi:hypothetical protein